METRKSGSMTAPHSRPQTNNKAFSAPMQSSQLMKLFEDEMREMFWIGKTLTTAIPKMIKNATSQELVEALNNHLMETEHQVIRVKRVFQSLDKRAIPKRCLAIEGLIKELGEKMEICDAGAMCDAGIVSAELKIQHYEIAAYETIRQFAETLGLDDAVELFEITIEEQKASVEKFTGVSVSAIEVYDTHDSEDEGLTSHQKDYDMHFA